MNHFTAGAYHIDSCETRAENAWSCMPHVHSRGFTVVMNIGKQEWMPWKYRNTVECLTGHAAA
jgi:ATP-dependent Clp protease adapter protein ClpS